MSEYGMCSRHPLVFFNEGNLERGQRETKRARRMPEAAGANVLSAF